MHHKMLHAARLDVRLEEFSVVETEDTIFPAFRSVGVLAWPQTGGGHRHSATLAEAHRL